MRIQLAPAIVLGHGLHRTEIHHVERATGAYIWSLAAPHRTEPVISARKNTSEKVVTDLGGGDVDYASNEAVVQKFLHGLSSCAGGVKYQAIEARSEQPYDVFNAGGGHAEHGEPQGRVLA